MVQWDIQREHRLLSKTRNKKPIVVRFQVLPLILAEQEAFEEVTPLLTFSSIKGGHKTTNNIHYLL